MVQFDNLWESQTQTHLNLIKTNDETFKPVLLKQNGSKDQQTHELRFCGSILTRTKYWQWYTQIFKKGYFFKAQKKTKKNCWYSILKLDNV